MRYISVCSGIEAATVAWEPLGWNPVAFAEIDKFASAVLAHRYSTVPNVGDFTQIKGDEFGSIDVLVGGTPCQDFSVAGLRKGMDGDRGQLTVEFARLAARLRSRWVVWENVPGVLSIDGGRAFGTFLRLLGECGYGFAYRILDAQYFGVPQRRRRVFVVGYLGDWRRAAAVLFERQSLSGDNPPRRETRKRVTSSFAPSSHGGYSDGVGSLRANGGDLGGGTGERGMLDPVNTDLIAYGCYDEQTPKVSENVMPTLRGRKDSGGEMQFVAFHTSGFGAQISDDVTATLQASDARLSNQVSGVIQSGGFIHPRQCRGSESSNQVGIKPDAQISDALTSEGPGATMQGMAVRRLTPRECERLQGFPDNFTKISAKTADSSRYKSLGNSMAVPVMRYIGERIAIVDNSLQA